MQRRTVLASAAALAAPLVAPRIGPSAEASVLRFIPQSDLSSIDPIWTAAYVVRNHAMMVFDTLYGTGSDNQVSPQMLAGHTVSAAGLTWTMILRDGLRWHDGEKVLARDCVASIRRWWVRDSFGQTVADLTNELSAPDDRTIRFRLKRPFPLLPAALGKPGSYICAMMPERLAQTDPFKQIPEAIGSGPFRFMVGERVPGAKVVYERNPDYVPRLDGIASFTAGPKRVFVDRVEWTVLPDAATAAAAMQAGEMDWWEAPTFDLLPLLKNNPDLVISPADPAGYLGNMRLNHLQPPFDNPALRRVLLSAVKQQDYMAAVAGDPANWQAGVGVFCPGSPMASQAGMQVLTSPRNIPDLRQAVTDAGYKGEKTVVLIPSDFPSLRALGEVGADLLQQLRIAVDAQYMDWGSLLQRIVKTDPVERGGWSLFHTYWSGLDEWDPAVHAYLRGNGMAAGRGWPTSPALESLRADWLNAANEQDRKRIARQIQQQAFIDVPFIPLGQIRFPTARRRSVTDVLAGYALFWNLRKA